MMAVVLKVLRRKRTTISEPRDSYSAFPHSSDKADITNRSHHLFPANKLRILLNTVL